MGIWKKFLNDKNRQLHKTSFVSNNLASDEFFHDFVTAAVNRLQASVDERPSNRIFPHVTPSAVQLYALICYFVLQIRHPKNKKQNIV